MHARTGIRWIYSAAAAVVLGSLATLLSGQSAAPAPARPAPQAAAPAGPVNFDDYFINKALRLDVYQVGDAKDELITLDNIYEEPIWPESPRELIPPFEACRYAIKVYDLASNKLIFAHAFDGL